MTTDQEAEYLKAKGWKRYQPLKSDLFWRDTVTTYLWEHSAAVKQQQWRDKEAAKNGKE